MTTINNSNRKAGAHLDQAGRGSRRDRVSYYKRLGRSLTLGVFASVFLAVGAHAQQVSTVISSNLLDPNYVTADLNDNIYLTDSSNNRIVELVPTTNGVLNFAGSDSLTPGTNNGVGVAARFSQPLGIVYDPYRNGLVVVDSGNQVLRFVSLSGVVTNLAGVEATPLNMAGGFSDGPALGGARFSSFMVGITADGAGNLFIADAGNNAIRRLNSNNVVSTVQVTNYTFHQPTAVVLDNNNNLWVADTKSNSICVISNISVISNQSVTIVAGTPAAGTNDSLTASAASFNLPSGLLWDPNGAGLFISDTGNHTIRRLWLNASVGGYSVQTVAGLPGNKGFVDGALAIAQFDNPVGLTVDAINNGYYVMDRANNALRRLQSTAPQPQVTTPVIGYVTFPAPPGGGTLVSKFNPITQEETFDNAAIIAIEAQTGSQTYMTFGPTPANTYVVPQIPAPGPKTGTSPLIYPGDGNAPPIASILAPLPDETMYVISEATGSPASSIVSARFRFVTANPTIGGNNGEVVTLTDNTSGALMWYTLDGSSPTNDGSNGIGPITNGQVISFVPLTNTTMTVAAFTTGFAPSGTTVQIFAPSNFVANAMTFGFASGEASSEFLAPAGSRFYAPVTLTLLPGTTMYSLQFNVTLTNLPLSAPLNPNLGFRFDSFLSTPVTLPNGITVLAPIQPGEWSGMNATNVTVAITATSTNYTTNIVPIIDSLVFTNSSENLLGVGWLELPGETNLYPAGSQDLITYSIAHEQEFFSANGQAVVGAYSFLVPPTATNGQKFQIQIGRPSADGNGFGENVFISTPTNGSLGQGPINSIKDVTVVAGAGGGGAVVPYLVGDVTPFRWFNAGDFGDLSLLNNDVEETFRYAIYGLSRILPGSAFADAYDSSDGTINSNFLSNSSALINNIKFGDGKVDVSDVFVTYLRSLDPALTWYERYWSNGVFYAQAVPNSNPTVLTPTVVAQATPAPASLPVGPRRSITVGADRVQGTAGQTVQIPVRVLAADTLPLTVVMLDFVVTPLDGSPVVTNAVAFTPSAGLGSPTITSSQGAGDYSAAWLNASAAGVSGDGVIGTLSVSLPPNATASSSYSVHFGHFSASPNGIATYNSTAYDGLITVGSLRTASTWNDGIPDWWRLTWFGTINNLLSAANLDPDDDGASNWQEYVAGTNPQDPTSVLQLTGSLPSTSFSVQWPSVVGKTYQVQSSTSLISTNWTVIASGLAGTGQTMQLSDPNLPAPPVQFYRVQVQ